MDTWLTLPDGMELRLREWESDSARASIVLVHGYGEHSGRYGHIAEALNREGFAVYAFDQRGHGESGGRRGYIQDFSAFVADFHVVFQHFEERVAARPLFLFGHSFGGLVATTYMVTHGPEIDGLVLSSGFFAVPEDTSPFLRRIATLLATFLPALPVASVDSAHLAHDAEVGRLYDADPLVYHGKIAARTGYEMMQATLRLQPRMWELDMPLLVMHGTADRLASPEGSKQLYDRALSPDKTLKLYKGAFHEVFNDLNREEFMSDLLTWLHSHTPAAV